MRLIAAVVIGSVAGAVTPSPALAGSAAGQLSVRVYDTVGLERDELTSALRTSASILQAAGISVAWRDCTPSTPDAQSADVRPCATTLRERELIVRVMAASPLTGSRKLGESIVDEEHEAGSLATIYGDRVRSMAAAAGVDPGLLFGRTIAHELGHLLLGSVQHTAQGLMRAVWSLDDLRNDEPGCWSLSKEEASAIRRHLNAAADRPAAVSTLPVTGVRVVSERGQNGAR